MCGDDIIEEILILLCSWSVLFGTSLVTEWMYKTTKNQIAPPRYEYTWGDNTLAELWDIQEEDIIECFEWMKDHVFFDIIIPGRKPTDIISGVCKYQIFNNDDVLVDNIPINGIDTFRLDPEYYLVALESIKSNKLTYVSYNYLYMGYEWYVSITLPSIPMLMFFYETHKYSDNVYHIKMQEEWTINDCYEINRNHYGIFFGYDVKTVRKQTNGSIVMPKGWY